MTAFATGESNAGAGGAPVQGKNSIAPTSKDEPRGRVTLRWSVKIELTKTPLSMAGLPGRRRCVRVNPPFVSRGPSFSLRLFRPLPKLQVASDERLWSEVSGASPGSQLPPVGLLAMRIFFR